MKDIEILKELQVNFREMNGHSDDWDEEADHFTDYQIEEGLMAVWSCYGLGIRMDKCPPFPVEGKTIVYSLHWGDKTVRHKIEGPTWGDVYKAADRCIRESGDEHHIFIENLDEYEFDENDEMELFTGS